MLATLAGSLMALVAIVVGARARASTPRVLDLGVLAGAAVFTALLGAVAILGASVSSRLAVLGPGEASSIAALLNCRGMMLLALGVELLDHRLIGSRLVAVFYLCALATTIMTGPLFARALGGRHRDRSGALRRAGARAPEDPWGI